MQIINAVLAWVGMMAFVFGLGLVLLAPRGGTYWQLRWCDREYRIGIVPVEGSE